MTEDQQTPVDYRQLMKKVEQAVEEIDQYDDVGETIQTVASLIIDEFRDQLGLYAGRLYQAHEDFYVLERVFGPGSETVVGTRVPPDYGPIELLLDQGIVYMDESDPRYDKELEERLGVSTFAAIEVGDDRYVLAFNVAQDHHREDILISLGILRHAINQKIRQARMEDVFREARKIQVSILPKHQPDFGVFDIHGRNEPMESVGGDFYDFIPLTDKILGLAIADVSGHGLPAALQTRDIHMGLRMGLGRDFKISRTVERLNQIIHESTLTSRFVSMFYGELEVSGAFIYVNAGHPPPFHLRADGTPVPLEVGGTVLGPVADATYERGFVHLAPGEVIVMYTDGISETQGEGGEEFGPERILEVVQEHQQRPAREIVDALFDAVARFSGDAPPGDDRTVVVVRWG